MDHLIEHWIAHYGLIAVFLGCLAEGKTAALLGGFFAHQQVFAPWQTVLAEIGLARFIVLNMLSALVWALLFTTMGYLFGLGAQQVLGRALHAHQRLWLALALVLAMGLAALLVRARRRRTGS